VAQATFEKKPTLDYVCLYNQGYSIAELAQALGLTYTPMRNMLLKNGVKLRTKEEAAKIMINRHPEWKSQFLKYRLSPESRLLSESKIKLLFFIFSSGVRVIRKKADYGLWYHYEKASLLKLLIRIYDEQKTKRNRGAHLGVFTNCRTKEQVIKILNSWYNEGGIRLGTSDI
jgi:hypothetical protein